MRRYTEVRQTSPILRLIVVVLLSLVVAPAAAAAQTDEGSGGTIDLLSPALDAIDFDPWLIQDDEVAPRRSDVLAYEVSTRFAAAETAAAVGEAEIELSLAEGVLDDAVAHRAEMELEVEGYSISIWYLGDLGLQEVYDSEAERARQAETVLAATEALIERVEDADAAIVDAEAAVTALEAVLAERVAADEIAQGLLRDATQIRERFESMVTARVEAIERWSHEALESESDDVEFVTINSVVVEVPIETPATPLGDEVAQAEIPTDAGAQAADEPAPVPTQSNTVAIPPIIVNAEIAGQVQALIGAARSDGINLHGGGYRPVADQITLRISHCGTSGYDMFEKPAGECTPPTARPGFSQHELGLAIDFTVDGAILTAGSPGFNWMVANASSYGLINLPSEPWHWSTTGG